MHNRRDMLVLTGLGAATAAAFPEIAFAADPVIPPATIAARQNAPVISKKVNKLYNLRPAGGPAQ